MTRVTVLLPIKGSAPYLAIALDSILGHRGHAMPVLIVIDDGMDCVASSTIRRLVTQKDCHHLVNVVKNDRNGLGAALQTGVDHVQTEYIARMDADDICLPSRFERQLVFLETHPEVVAVGSFVQFIDEDGDPLGIGFNKSTTHEDIVDALLCRRKGVTGLCHPSVMMRTQAVRQVGGYRDVKMGEDIDLFLRLAEVGKLANIPEVLLRYRLHVKSVTHNRTEEERRDSQRVRIEAYQRMGIPLPKDLDSLLPPPPSDKLRLYRYWARMAARHGYLRTARKYALRLVLRAPNRWDNWKTLLRAYIGYKLAPPRPSSTRRAE